MSLAGWPLVPNCLEPKLSSANFSWMRLTLTIIIKEGTKGKQNVDPPNKGCECFPVLKAVVRFSRARMPHHFHTSLWQLSPTHGYLKIKIWNLASDVFDHRYSINTDQSSPTSPQGRMAYTVCRLSQLIFSHPRKTILSEHWNLLSAQPLTSWVTKDNSSCLSVPGSPSTQWGLQAPQGCNAGRGEDASEAALELFVASDPSRLSVSSWGQRLNGLHRVFTMLPSTVSAWHTAETQQTFPQWGSLLPSKGPWRPGRACAQFT